METPDTIQYSHRNENIFKVYKRRWYILMMYSIYCCTQSAVWNTWGPISRSAEEAFGWDDSTIALMNNWGPITYVLTGLFFPWLLQVKGLRWATMISVFCVAAGTAFRVITSEPSTATILIHVGQILNGAGGPISAAAIPAVSATWFHPTERVTATSISNSLGSFGTALGFILGPVLVTEMPSNKSLPPHKFLLFQNDDVDYSVQEPLNKTSIRIHTERDQIMRYMYYECGWSVLLFIVMMFYFPSKPPNPPCVSATKERPHYWRSLLSLRKKGYFLIASLLFGISTGVFGGWTSVLNINLQTVSISEKTAGWMGFYSTVAGCVASTLFGRFADKFVRHIKLFIIALYMLTTVALIFFTLMLNNILSTSVVGLYVTIIVANGAINVAVPLFYELTCELAYPTSEGAANGVLTLCMNFCSVVFLAVLSIPNIDTMWINWMVTGSVAACIPLIAVLKGRFSRLEVDEDIHTESYANNVVVVTDGSGEDDPLLSHYRKVSYVSEQGGFQNPVLTDEALPRCADKDFSVPEFRM